MPYKPALNHAVEAKVKCAVPHGAAGTDCKIVSPLFQQTTAKLEQIVTTAQLNASIESAKDGIMVEDCTC